MKLNVGGKIQYICETVFNYKNWITIFIDRLANIKTKNIIMRNGLCIESVNNELVIDLTNEIFVKKVYTPKFLTIEKGDNVMDIGANIGVFSLFAVIKGANKIYSVEPYGPSVKQLRLNFKKNGLRPPEIIQAAISDRKGTAKLYVGDIDSHSSIISNKDVKTNFFRIKISTLENLLFKYKIDKIDFLKIDCEGGEGEIFKLNNPKVWLKINKISIEYHDNLSKMSHFEILKKLKILGYETKTRKTGKYLGYIYAWKDK